MASTAKPVAKPAGGSPKPGGIVKPPAKPQKPKVKKPLLPKAKPVPKAGYAPAPAERAPAQAHPVADKDSLQEYLRNFANNAPAAKEEDANRQGYGGHASGTYGASYADQAALGGGYAVGASGAYEGYGEESKASAAGGGGYGAYDPGALRGAGGAAASALYNHDLGGLRGAGGGSSRGVGGYGNVSGVSGLGPLLGAGYGGVPGFGAGGYGDITSEVGHQPDEQGRGRW